MFKVIDKEAGHIELVQGDSGELTAQGILTDKNYEMYFGFKDENRQLIGFEVMIPSNYQPMVTFAIPASLTNLLTVPLGEETKDYYYYIKRCYKDTGLEDTQQIGNVPIGQNVVTVIPKGLEGTDD